MNTKTIKQILAAIAGLFLLSACASQAPNESIPLLVAEPSVIVTHAATEQMATAVPVEAPPLPSFTLPDLTVVAEDGTTVVDVDELAEVLDSTPVSELSQAEIDGLLFMREEEKLARDVYFVYYDLWGQNTFQNIANAEQTHMDAVKQVLDQYALEDSALPEVGLFNNADLQAIYDQFVAEGSQSLSAALHFSGAIEEIDILDLEQAAAESSNVDILLLYENLMKGSRNHLRAFTSVLQRRVDEIYQPQYLSLDAYLEIVNSATETNGRGNNNN